MALVRWDPLRSMAALQNRINQVFDDAFPQPRDQGDDIALCDWRPAVDIYETQAAVVLTAELPGVKREDVSLEVKDNALTLKGERLADGEVKENRYYRRERCFGKFHRSFTLQDAINPDLIRAKFKDGVLEIEIPKPEIKNPQQIKVTIE